MCQLVELELQNCNVRYFKACYDLNHIRPGSVLWNKTIETLSKILFVIVLSKKEIIQEMYFFLNNIGRSKKTASILEAMCFESSHKAKSDNIRH